MELDAESTITVLLLVLKLGHSCITFRGLQDPLIQGLNLHVGIRVIRASGLTKRCLCSNCKAG